MAERVSPVITVKPAPVPVSPPPTVLVEFTREELVRIRERVMLDIRWSTSPDPTFWESLHEVTGNAIRLIDVNKK